MAGAAGSGDVSAQPAGPHALPGLTSLRFIAALLVLLNHCGFESSTFPLLRSLASNGYEAVSFFFVLSGFVLSYNYYSRSAKDVLRGSLPEFFRGRMARIYPMYLLALLVAWPHFIHGFKTGQVPAGIFWPSLISVPTLLQSWFPALAMAWNIPAWSLSVEAFCYCLFPLLLAKLDRQSLGFPLGLCLLVLLLAEGFGKWAHASPPFRLFLAHSPVIHVASFAAGICLGLQFRRLNPGWLKARWWPLGLAGLLGCAFTLRDILPPWIYSKPVLVPLYCALIFAVAQASGGGGILESAWMVKLGAASYSLYILHAPLYQWYVTASRAWLHVDPHSHLALPSLFCGGMVVLSLGTYRYVEVPAGAWIRARTKLREQRSDWRSCGRRIRVLHFASVINRYDFIDTIVRHVDRTRFAPMACTFSKTSNIQATEYEGAIPYLTLNVRGRRDYPAAILRLAAILRKHQVDILHAHHYDEALLGAAAVSLVSGCRLVIGRHYHDEIYLLSRRVRLRALVGLESLANAVASRIVVPSTVIRTLLMKRQSVAREKIDVIPYGFEFEGDKYRRSEPSGAAQIRASLGIEGRFVVGNFGRHHPLKGQEYLLRAFAIFASQHAEAVLLLVGDGPHGIRLRQIAEELGLTASGKAIFTGWRREAWKILEAVDVVVHSTLHEALPQLMVEAMAKAKPLVITNVSGACDHARHMDNAYLIEPRSETSIVAALEWVYRHPEAARLSGERACAYVRRELSVERIIPRFEELYERIA